MQTVQLDRVAPQPWRNGGGVTRELLAWPDAAAWQLRVSVADIARDGPFSAYAGVDRWFTVLQGAGVALQFTSGIETLTQHGTPRHFDGAAAPGCRLLDGATRDLNLMSLRSGGRSSMQRAEAAAGWASPALWRGVFCAGPARLHVDGNDPLPLAANSLAWSAQAAHQHWRLAGDGDAPCAWWLAFHPHGT